MQICHAEKGTEVTVYDDPYLRRDKDDYAKMEALENIVGCQTIGTFERDTTYGNVKVTYRSGGNLDGKVSSMRYTRP